MKALSVFLLAMWGAACLGCGRSTSYTSPEGDKTTVTQKGENVELTFEGKEGQRTKIGASVPLPEDFPKDVAIYPKATVFASTKDKTGTMSVVLKITEAAGKVGPFYQDKLKEAGWEIEQTMNMPTGMMLQASKEGRQLHVVVAEGDSGETIVNLGLQKAE